MNSIVLQSATRFAAPLLILFGAFSFVRGHNEPGGGFIGGLIISAAMALIVLSHGVDMARKVLRVDPRSLLGIGLLVSLLSGFIGPLSGKEFLTGIWVTLPGIGGSFKLGTPVLFDLGVMFIVIGMACIALFELDDTCSEEGMKV